MRIGTVLLVIWLTIGAIAGGQRHYYTSSNPDCAKAGTIAVTVIAGPLNYIGVNPKTTRKVPQPSKKAPDSETGQFAPGFYRYDGCPANGMRHSSLNAA